MKKQILIIGANSDIALECIKIYQQNNFDIFCATRDVDQLNKKFLENKIENTSVFKFNLPSDIHQILKKNIMPTTIMICKRRKQSENMSIDQKKNNV